MTTPETLLAVLLKRRGLHRYGMFCVAYNDAAAKVDPRLRGTHPSRAQHHRWVTGELKRLPNTDHCRVLEVMFPEWRAEQLFSSDTSELIAEQKADDSTDRRKLDTDLSNPETNGHIESFAGVTKVFASRADFFNSLPPHQLLDAAKEIRAVGLSLNMLCQQYPDRRLQHLVEKGAKIQCLFLDPDGRAIAEREREEGHTKGNLTMLTKLNIEVLTRIRNRLPSEVQERIELATYDETIRFNITLIDGQTCIMQPYLPQARGVDSPTFFIEQKQSAVGLFETFEEVFKSIWNRSKPL